jgi:hypothetical protein
VAEFSGVLVGIRSMDARDTEYAAECKGHLIDTDIANVLDSRAKCGCSSLILRIRGRATVH